MSYFATSCLYSGNFSTQEKNHLLPGPPLEFKYLVRSEISGYVWGPGQVQVRLLVKT